MFKSSNNSSTEILNFRKKSTVMLIGSMLKVRPKYIYDIMLELNLTNYKNPFKKNYLQIKELD